VHSFAPAEMTWLSTMSGFELDAITPISQKAMIVATLNNRSRLEGAVPGAWFLRRSQGVGGAEAIIPDKWIIGVPDDAEPLVDQSLMSTSIYSGIFGQRILGSWTVFVDRYGIPFLHVEIHDYEDEQGKETARQVIRRAGDDHGVVTSVNDKMQIKVVDGAQVARSGTTDVQGRYLDASRQRTDRVWVGGPLVMGTGAGGAYNQGQIHRDAFFALLQGDARYVTQTLQCQMVGAFMRLNRHDPHLAPVVTLRVRLESPGVVANLAAGLGQVGYKIDPDELSTTLGYTITGGPVQ
jgi:phage gp29-like protein